MRRECRRTPSPPQREVAREVEKAAAVRVWAAAVMAVAVRVVVEMVRATA